MKVLFNKETGAQGASAPQTDNAAKGGDSTTVATPVAPPSIEEQVKAKQLEVGELEATINFLKEKGMSIPPAFQLNLDGAKAQLESLNATLKTEGARKEAEIGLRAIAGKFAPHIKEAVTLAVTIEPGVDGGAPTITVQAKGTRHAHSVKGTGTGAAPTARATKMNGVEYASKRAAFDVAILDAKCAEHVKSYVDMAKKGTSFNATLPLDKLAAAGLIKLG